MHLGYMYCGEKEWGFFTVREAVLIKLKVQNSINYSMSKTEDPVIQSGGERDTDELISDIKNNMETLFKMRLIEKLSRPSSDAERRKTLELFKGKFNEMHTWMEKVKSNLGESLGGLGNQGIKSEEKSTKAMKAPDYNDQIRKIENRYKEVQMILAQIFKQGSFKHYSRISSLHQLPQLLYAIDIEGWSSDCLRQRKTNQSCC